MMQFLANCVFNSGCVLEYQQKLMEAEPKTLGTRGNSIFILQLCPSLLLLPELLLRFEIVPALQMIF